MGTVTGTSMTFGTATTIATGRVGYTSTVYDSVNNRIVVTYTRVNSGDNNGPVMAAVGTVSGTSISFGTAVQITGTDLPFYWVSSTFDPVNNRVVVSYSLFITSGSIGNYGYIKAFQVSGSTVTAIGSQVLILGPLYIWGSVCWDEVSGQILMFYSTANQNVRVKIYSLVGSILTATSTVNLFNTDSAIYISAASSDAGGWFTVVFGGANSPSSSASSIGYRAPFNNLTANNFVGFSSANYANAQTATVNIVGSVITNQTGLIPGRKYYVQPNGTLAQTAATPSVYAGQSTTATTLIVKG
jgi:hypothetical protein